MQMLRRNRQKRWALCPLLPQRCGNRPLLGLLALLHSSPRTPLPAWTHLSSRRHPLWSIRQPDGPYSFFSKCW